MTEPETLEQIAKRIISEYLGGVDPVLEGAIVDALRQQREAGRAEAQPIEVSNAKLLKQWKSSLSAEEQP